MNELTQPEREAVVVACERVMELHGRRTNPDLFDRDRIFTWMFFRSYLDECGMQPHRIDFVTAHDERVFPLYLECLSRPPRHGTPIGYLSMFYPEAFSNRQMDVAYRECGPMTPWNVLRMGAEEWAYKAERLSKRKAKAVESARKRAAARKLKG